MGLRAGFHVGRLLTVFQCEEGQTHSKYRGNLVGQGLYVPTSYCPSFQIWVHLVTFYSRFKPSPASRNQLWSKPTVTNTCRLMILQWAHGSLAACVHGPSYSNGPPKLCGWMVTLCFKYMRTPPTHYFLEFGG